MSTLFCSTCGQENDGEAELCERCGAELDILQRQLTRGRRPPLHWPAFAVFALLLTALLCAAHLLSPKPDLPRDKHGPGVVVPEMPREPRGFGFRLGIAQVVTTRRVMDPAEIREIQYTLQEKRIRLSSEVVQFLWLPLEEQRWINRQGRDIYVRELRAGPVALGGTARLLWQALLFVIVAVFVTLLFGRRVFWEVALGGVVGVCIQLVIWLAQLDWNLGYLLLGKLTIIREGYQMQMPAGFFVGAGGLVLWLAGGLSSQLTAVARERLSGVTSCLHCQGRIEGRPLPPACPHCRAPLSQSRVQWRWVSAGLAGTLVGYAMFMSLLGPRAKVYFHCDYWQPEGRCHYALGLWRKHRELDTEGNQPPEQTSWTLFGEIHDDPRWVRRCRKASLALLGAAEPDAALHARLGRACYPALLVRTFAMRSDQQTQPLHRCLASLIGLTAEHRYFGGADVKSELQNCRGQPREAALQVVRAWQPKQSYFVVLHNGRYVGLLAPLFLLAPLLLGWRLGQGNLVSAGVLIPLNWLGAMLTGMFAFGLAGFEGAFFLSLRLHLIALVIWSIVGFVGALIGNRLNAGGNLRLDDELDD